MAAKSPVAILYDAAGNAISSVLKTAVRRLQTAASIQNADGTTDVTVTGTRLDTSADVVSSVLPAGAATEATLALVEAILIAIRDTAGVKKITDALPAGTNLLGELQVQGDGGLTITSSTDGAKERFDVSALIVAPAFGDGIIEELTDPVGAGVDFAVDGSVTPVAFEYTGDATDSVTLTSLTIILEDNGFKVGDNFMNQATLSTGLVLEIKSQDVVLPSFTFFRTRDIVAFASLNPFVFAGASALMEARRVFQGGITLAPQGTYVSDDYIRLTVNDNLSSLSFGGTLLIGRKI